MSLKKRIFIVLCVIAAALLNILIIQKVSLGDSYTQTVQMEVSLQAEGVTDIQTYYAVAGADLSDANSTTVSYDWANTEQTLEFSYSMQNDLVRLDLGNKQQSVTIYNISFSAESYGTTLNLETLAGDDTCWNDVSAITVNEDGSITFQVTGEDPYVYVSSYKAQLVEQMQKSNQIPNMVFKLIVCFVIDLVAIYSLRHIDALLTMPLNIWRNRKLLMTLAKNDFKTNEYITTYRLSNNY